MKEPNEIQEIKITYKDGSEKIVTRGVCFSVREENETVFVECDGLAGTEADEIAVLAIVSRIAKELGIDEELINKSEEVKKDNEQ